MSDSSDFRKLETEAEMQEEDSSFAKWLPPLLSSEPSPGAPPVTLTGLGPLSGSQGTLFPPSVPGMDDAPANAAALATELRDALDDDADDNEPTRVITQLFPGLSPKTRRSSPNGGAETSSSSVPPPPAVSVPTNSQLQRYAAPLESQFNAFTDLPPTATVVEESVAPPEQPEAETAASIANAPTQESELLSLLAQSVSKRAAPPARLDEPAVVIRDTPVSVHELPVPRAPRPVTERNRPTMPASRKPTSPAELVTPAAVTPERSSPPWSATVRPRSRPSSRAALRIAGAAFAASALVTVLILRAVIPGKGSVLVTAVGAEGMPVDQARVLVDGAVACSPVPCRVNNVREGRHAITVTAPGYQRLPDKTISVEPGSEALVHFALAPENTSGLHVRVDQPGLRVFLDGEDRGAAPLTLGGLAPGEHRLRLEGKGFATFEQKLTLKPNAVVTLTPDVVPVQAVIDIQPGPGVERAAVEVLGGPERKAVMDLPARLSVPANGTYRVRATRPGYRSFDAVVTFAAGQTEKQVLVELTPEVIAPSRGLPIAPVVLEDAKPSVPPASAAGTLSLNSTPVSNVLVNGRPMGATPRQVQLPAGNHTVVFVHPTLGRKSLSVQVAPGKTAVAATTF